MKHLLSLKSVYFLTQKQIFSRLSYAYPHYQQFFQKYYILYRKLAITMEEFK